MKFYKIMLVATMFIVMMCGICSCVLSREDALNKAESTAKAISCEYAVTADKGGVV